MVFASKFEFFDGFKNQFWSYRYSLGLMRTASVDTQKTTMDLPVTTDYLENQIYATQKLFRP
jgi:hypothetical protein